MRLKALTAQGVRGFNARQTVDFSLALTLIDGANGTGKTSLGEGLEWLLYGTTAKRQKGESISKREYKGSYRNLHWRGPGRPLVEASVLCADGQEHVLTRELNEDESSQAYLDGSAPLRSINPPTNRRSSLQVHSYEFLDSTGSQQPRLIDAET